jgi:hypothetical protein
MNCPSRLYDKPSIELYVQIADKIQKVPIRKIDILYIALWNTHSTVFLWKFLFFVISRLIMEMTDHWLRQF